MAETHRTVGVVVARRALNSPWQSHQWVPAAVLPAAPDVARWTPLGNAGSEETFYAGAADLGLHAGETAHYRDNLRTERPSLWVAMRPAPNERVEIVCVTADPYEGEALAGNVDDIVETVPMPDELQIWVAEFFNAHHVEREFVKRQRKR